MSKNVIHRRLVSNSEAFFEELKKLGFKEIDSDGHGLNKVRKFMLGNKLIHSSHRSLSLIEKVKGGGGGDKVHHTGLTIHDEMLTFFAQRNPTQIKN